jgi:error-prone DNA polymerase
MREKLSLLRAITNQGMTQQKNGDIVKVAGLVLVRQRPGTAKGVWFVTLEDETEIANLVIFANVYEQYKKEVIKARVLMVEGKLQIAGKVIHVIVQKCFDVTSMLSELTTSKKASLPALSRADEMTSGAIDKATIKKGNAVIHAGRNFR